MDNSPVRQPQPELEELQKLLMFKFDPVLYADKDVYRTDYGKKLIYFVIKISQTNKNITLNQVCSLLRNTLQIPEDLTRSTICTILTAAECRVFKLFESAKEVKHLKLINDYQSLEQQLIQQYPELVQYVAPVYGKGKVRE